MRLIEYELYSYRLPYERPVRWSDVVEDAAPLVLLRLVADNGASGVAEITVKPTWCGVTAASLRAMLDEVVMPLVTGIELDDADAVRVALDRVPECSAAKALVDNACWDLRLASRQARGTSESKRRCPLSWALTRQAPKAMADEAARMIESHGFRTLKVKGGQGLEIDIAGMREIRAAAGETITLYVDANGAYPASEAARYVEAMARAGAVMVEDPCQLSPGEDFEALQARCPVPILVDFGCTSVRDAALFAQRGMRALSIKPGRFGLTQAHDMQTLAERARCAVVVGLMGESAIGTLAAMHLPAMCRSTPLPAELSWFLAMHEQITQVPLVIEDGNFLVPEFTSLASIVDWMALRRHRV